MSDAVHESELRPLTAVGLVDRAIAITRNLPPHQILRAVFPSLLFAWLVVAIYVAERVEGIRALRPLFALALVFAHALRAVALARFSGSNVKEMLGAFGLEHSHGSASVIVRTNLWLGVDLWAWSFILVLAVRVHPWLVPAVLPLFSLRALVVPTWLCDADHGAERSGFAVLRAALDKGDGQRLRAVFAELLLLLGAIGLGLNLGAFAALAVSTTQDLLGLDLSFVRAFLSPENHFALLVIACLSLCVIDPLRAVVAAQLYVENRLTRDGLLARSLVERCAQASKRVLLAACLATSLGLAAESSAQEPSPEDDATESSASEHAAVERAATEESVPAELECDDGCQRARAEDDAIADTTDAILRDSIFSEFPNESLFDQDENESAVSRWLEDVLRWLFELGDDAPDNDNRTDSAIELPGPIAFGLIALLIAALGVTALLMRTHEKVPAGAPVVSEADPFDVAPEDHLRDADALSERDLRAALRALYLAALVRLGRRGLITLSHERTNGMYLRELKGQSERATFAALTRIFERVVYGNVEPTLGDYGECRLLAERLCSEGELSS